MQAPTSSYTKRISNPVRRSKPTRPLTAVNRKTTRKVVRP
jgi:hypothetical protein